MAETSKSIYVPTPQLAAEPMYEDLECCLITLRDRILKKRPTRETAFELAIIDRCLPVDLRPLKAE